MNQKLTVALSAAFMSFSGFSATSLAESSEIKYSFEAVKAAKSISTSGNKKQTIATHKPKFTPEKGLTEDEYTYIVRLKDPAVANYDGGVAGLNATNPQRKFRSLSRNQAQKDKQRLNIKSADVVAYSNYLQQRQNEFRVKAAGMIANSTPLYTYKLALNGMALRLSPDEAKALSKLPEVAFVEREQVLKLHTDTSQELIGSPDIWDGSAVPSGIGAQGEGVIVGIFDTGVNTDSRSFADIGDDGYDHTNPWGEGVYVGDCAGDFPELCNDKLIGVRSYPTITDVYGDTSVFPPDLPRNGEDYDGHGSHTAGTAAGNILLDVPVLARVPEEESDGTETGLVFEQMSGVAPHANIVSYQVCWPGQFVSSNDDDLNDEYWGCPTSVVIQALNDAIADGIDVINFSIGGGGFPWGDADDAAWLAARNAGIFSAHSAGNSGPDNSSSLKHAPWITAVAASTHGRTISFAPKQIGEFTGGDTTLEALEGLSQSGAYTGSIVYAGDYDNPNSPEEPEQCLEPFPEGTFNGEIVVCDRGQIARVAKAVNVAAGGAGALVLANLQDGASSVVADAFVIPGIHIDADNGDLLRTWLATGSDHAGTITASEGSIDISDPDRLAGFSSRGPNTSIGTLVPTLTAPGVDIYAAYTDQDLGNNVTGPLAADFAFLDGTSMASPHVAGAAALLKSAMPSWTPDNVRSALAMTAETNVLSQIDNVSPSIWYEMGSGRIQLDKAIQTGLVMDEVADNYLNANPLDGGDPTTLNLPSMSDNNCVGQCSWTRTVTATKDGDWLLEVEPSDDEFGFGENIELTVSPESFSLQEGESQEITVTASVLGATNGYWQFGVLKLTSQQSPDLHMPIAVIPDTGTLPESVSMVASRDMDSSLIKDLTALEISEFTARSLGLTKATISEGEVSQDSDNSEIFDDLTDGIYQQQITVPSGASYVVSEILETTSPDLDLFLIQDSNQNGTLDPDDEILDESRTFTSDERINFQNPVEGTYWLVIQNWASSGQDVQDTFSLSHAIVDGQQSENLVITAQSNIPLFEPFDVRVAWDISGAMLGDVYYGAFDVGSSADFPGNLGSVVVDITRGEDDVQVAGTTDARLGAGDQVTFAVEVAANFTPEDRLYDISVTLPDGVSLVPQSVTGGGTAENGVINWSLNQLSLIDAKPEYVVTTNAFDAACGNPDFGLGTGYTNLEDFGIGMDTLEGDDVLATFDVVTNLYGELNNFLTVTSNGFVSLSPQLGAQPFSNQLMPDPFVPNGVVAPLWRDMDLRPTEGAGITVASAGSAVTFVEWDNMQTIYEVGDTRMADKIDFQVVFDNVAGPNEPDIIFSYNDVTHDFGDAIPTSIGIESADGTEGLTTHYVPYFNSSDAPIGSVETDVQDGLQVCFYLQDVSDAPTRLEFTLQIEEGNAGGPLQVMAMSSLPEHPGTAAVASMINDNVQVEGAPIVTIAGEMNAMLEVLEVRELALMGSVTEPNGDDYTIEWTQVAGPAAVIAGNGIAEAVLIAPEVTQDEVIELEMTATDSNGNSSTAYATVTVKNNLAPSMTINAPTTVKEGDTFSISVSTSDPEGDPVTVYIDGVMTNSITTTAPGTNQDITITFEVTASDGLNMVTETVSVEVKQKDGGSLGWIALLLLPVVYLRRRVIRS